MVQYAQKLDSTFGALSDSTRRGILTRLGKGDASVSDLAGKFAMTLTGMRKHIQVLENAGLVTTEKVGRVRTARLTTRRMADESRWIASYGKALNERLNQLDEFLERTRSKP
ncbi:MAG: metalloregulator ArsR/SmtB family transcription factor [Gemmatimonadaceae bacterium]